LQITSCLACASSASGEGRRYDARTSPRHWSLLNVTLSPRRSARRGRRPAALALAVALLASACGTPASPDSPGPTIDLHPSQSAAPSTSATASQAPTTAPATPATTAPPTALPTATSTPSLAATPPPATAVPSASAVTSLDWSDCGAPFECATLEVPLDYAHPTADQIKLALIRLPAERQDERIGSLLVNPGGPGASGVDFVESSAQTLYSQQLRDHFDIVGFDPRGVGASTPVECLDGKELDRLADLDPTPDTPQERDDLVAAAKAFDQACEANSGKLLPFMSTEDAARDMDRIRIALGEDKLTYFGFSYGTFLGTVYAGLFPQNVRALVLDGAIDPLATFEQQNEIQAEGFSRSLDAFFAACKADPTCAFYNKGDPAGAFDRLMAEIDRKPLPAIAIPDSRTVGPGLAFTGVLYALYSKSSWPYLEQGLALAQLGDGSVLLVMADAYNERSQDGTYKNVAAANTAVNCLDHAAPTDVAAYDAMAKPLEQKAPRFGEAIAYSGLNCAFWPVKPKADTGPITAEGAPPILVVGTTGDPATPYAWAQALARELSSGVLLTRKGEGHTAYGDSACIQQAVDTYLVTLKTPPADTVCDP
jgi:pimeloyl-ACP methyl ester carboxylesterase